MVAHALESVLQQTVVERVQVLLSFSKSSVYDVAWPERVNALLPAVLGDYTVLLGDDDELLPTFAERVLDEAARTDADVISTNVEQFGDDPAVFVAGEWTHDAFKQTTPIWFSTAIRTSLFRLLGGLDAKLLYQDWDLWYRAFRAGASRAHVNEVLWRWRWHKAAQGTANIAPERGRQQIYDKHPELAGV